VSRPPRHGHTRGRTSSPTYVTWRRMLQRCFDANHKDFARYGARGISVCARWLSFDNFLVDMGERPRDTTIDRFPDKDGNYQPGNCRWATQRQQHLNMKSNRRITIGGETLTTTEWAQRAGILKVTLHARIFRYGWSPERAISEPVVKRAPSSGDAYL